MFFHNLRRASNVRADYSVMFFSDQIARIEMLRQHMEVKADSTRDDIVPGEEK